MTTARKVARARARRAPGAPGAAGTLKALAALMRARGGRTPYASAAAAKRAALDQTMPHERPGLELLSITLPASVGAQPDANAPALWGPLSWYDWGDPEECAEEYGIDRQHVTVGEIYDACEKRWARVRAVDVDGGLYEEVD